MGDHDTLRDAHTSALTQALGPLTLEELHELALADPQFRGDYRNGSACRARRDGDCDWPLCPQRRHYTGHCPLDMPPFVITDGGENE